MLQHCFSKNSVHAQDDIFFRIQHSSRKIHKEIIENLHLIDEFERLCEGFTFVDLWDDPEIIPEMFRIYSRNVPAKEAPLNFIYSVKIIHFKINILIKGNQIV